MMQRQKVREYAGKRGRKVGVVSNLGHVGLVDVDTNVIPAAGTAGQVLAKASNDDFDTEWVAQDGQVVPTGGTINQVLGKKSGTSLDVEWQDNPSAQATSGTPVNTVVAVPTATDIVFNDNGGAAVPSTGDTITFGTEVYEFTTDGTTPLTLPTNIRISLEGITNKTLTAQAFKTALNAGTAYTVAGTGDGATITITASANYAAYNTLTTVTSVTGPATATYAAATFGDGGGASTTGVDAVTATPGVAGTILFDTTNIYIATATNVWKKVTLTSPL